MRQFTKFTESTGQELFVDAAEIAAVKGHDGEYTGIYLTNGHKFLVREKLVTTLLKLDLVEKVKVEVKKDANAK